MLVITVRGGEGLGDRALSEDEVQPVKVRLVGVGRSVGVGVERGRTTSTVVDVRGGEGDTLSVLDIEVSLIMSKLATGN